MGFRQTTTVWNDLKINQMKPYVAAINQLQEPYAALSDAELAAKTAWFKERLRQGETLDGLMVEAFATVREAARRVLGQFPYDVQVMGAIALHQGHIAEMKTGEGKTLTATMPLYLNALTGQGAILVTTNDYLAERDGQEMGAIYRFLGLSVGIAVFDQKEPVEAELKRAIYACDIIYVTSSGLGFDYLNHHLAASQEDQFMRPFHYVIIDEADAVLLDNAQTPLIISGLPRVQSNLFEIANQFILSLHEDDVYFEREKKYVYLTQQGISYAESYFAINNLYDKEQWALNRHVNLALRAHYLFRRNYDYVVQDGEIKLLDHRTGRILEGTRLQSGIHQAIETKERLDKTKESRAMGSITYQSLFNMFPKLSGMTGTAKLAEDELLATYRVPVLVIPTNEPIRRIDYPDQVYVTLPEKLAATIALVKTLHAKQQPILLVSGTVEITEIYSKLLLQEGIAHSTLTANNIAKEALIIQEAGQRGAVTCATVLAGRGTDIKLGDGVADLGGLAVIGTERMANSRMDSQLRGRAGRQGDPGSSQFFVSLEDDLLMTYGTKWAKDYFKKHNHRERASYGKPLTASRFQKLAQTAQLKSEDKAFSARQTTVQFDESLRVQRQKIYDLRHRLILGEIEVAKEVYKAVDASISRYLKQHKKRSPHELRRYILDHFTYQFRQFPLGFDVSDNKMVKAYLLSLFYQEMAQKESLLKTKEALSAFYRLSVLKAIDVCWVEEVDSLQQLKGVVATRQLGQRNALFDYYRESLEAYQEMTHRVQDLILRHVMLSTIEDTSETPSIYFV